jgi:hypothetical protein
MIAELTGADLMTNMEHPGELHKETQREFWAAEQAAAGLARQPRPRCRLRGIGGVVRLSNVGGVPSSLHAAELQALARPPY